MTNQGQSPDQEPLGTIDGWQPVTETQIRNYLIHVLGVSPDDPQWDELVQEVKDEYSD